MISDAEIAELEGYISDNNYEPLCDNYSNIIPALITRLRECESALKALDFTISPIAAWVKHDCITNGDTLSLGDKWLDCEDAIQSACDKARAYFEKVEGEK